jgi:lipoprotein-anchoring transpeptidase ErfK/SrfK
VTVAGVAVGGMTPDAAAAAVADAFGQPVELRFQRTRILVTPDVLGASANVAKAIDRAKVAAPNASVDLAVAIDRNEVTSFVALLAKRFDRKPVDTVLVLRHAKPFLSPALPGRVLDRKGALTKIVAALSTHKRGPVVLAAKTIQPAKTPRDFGPVIVIRRGANRLSLYDGMRLKRAFPVATGQKVYPTPLGRFQVVVKWRNPWWYPPASPWAKGEKPVPPGPDNPLGTRWMGISSPGVGIHGTPNPGSIGYSLSHGCIRMYIRDAEWLFDHVEIGTTVFIVPS